ncbi:MAG: low molecular weight protein-tyrosine-phosphatase [Porticoccaceae bacterium]|nr:low molecular weight phosphotyrosine protein phosphatase [Pseudomonadales bacterium]MCP5171759.1 low molecular weight phosphotyrosine protein phosphatase [Pseudomonadales bacterium]
MKADVGVLFVCLGNICRSPTAHSMFEAMVSERGLSGRVIVDSAGTGDWHIGKPPDKRAQATALGRGMDMSHLRARRVTRGDFQLFDYILAMDYQNLADLKEMRDDRYKGYLGLFLPFGGGPLEEVPDPYFGGKQGFEDVFDLVERASAGLLNHICEQHGW